MSEEELTEREMDEEGEWMGGIDPGPRAGAKPGAKRHSVDFEKLEEESSRHRVLLMRGGAVVAVTTLISLGGAFFIHGVFAGVFILGLFLPWGHSSGGGQGKGGAEGEGEMMVVADGEESHPAMAALGKAETGKAAAMGAVAMGPLPALPEAPMRVDVPAVAQAMANPIAVPEDFGTVRVPAPASMNLMKANVETTVAVAPPTQINGAVNGAANGAEGGMVNGAKGAAGKGAGDDGEEEPLFNLRRPGSGSGMGSGNGGGPGSGPGRGVDRGASGADLPEPLVLDAPEPAEIPQWLQFDPPKKAVTFRVTVQANGTVGGVQVLQSSGRPAVDAFYKALVLTWKYSPAVVAGRRVERTKDISFDPGF